MLLPAASRGWSGTSYCFAIQRRVTILRIIGPEIEDARCFDDSQHLLSGRIIMRHKANQRHIACGYGLFLCDQTHRHELSGAAFACRHCADSPVIDRLSHRDQPSPCGSLPEAYSEHHCIRWCFGSPGRRILSCGDHLACNPAANRPTPMFMRHTPPHVRSDPSADIDAAQCGCKCQEIHHLQPGRRRGRICENFGLPKQCG